MASSDTSRRICEDILKEIIDGFIPDEETLIDVKERCLEEEREGDDKKSREEKVTLINVKEICPEDPNEKNEKDITEGKVVPILDSQSDQCIPLLSNKQEELGDKKEEHIVNISINSSEHELLEGNSNGNVLVTFLKGEWGAFKREMKTKLSDKEKKETVHDFNSIKKEWKYRPENKEHWKNQKEKKKGECCTPLFYTILIGIIFILIPNCMVALDFKAAYEYLGGEWYIKRDGDPLPLNETASCKEDPNTGIRQCFEQDIIWGIMTLFIVFLPGICWSLGIFIQFALYLRKTNPAVYDRRRMLFFFFIPLGAVSVVTFPLQLFIVSLIACFNQQDHWMILTTKIGIAEGLFNAHFQYLLQLFIFFVRADRHPSPFQYLAAFGSLLFLVWSRIESLLMDRGGHSMSPGQKAWWVCRFGPMFLFNSAFKVGSISLICALLRYNAIWLYGTIIFTWCFLQFLFNEQYLPRKWYFLFIGAGMHSVSVAHISEDLKMIHAKSNAGKNVLWVTRLSDIQLKANMWFQNLIWFFLNSTIIVTLTVVAWYEPEVDFPTFWPISSHTISFKDNKVYQVLYIIAPVILIAGAISLSLLWSFDFQKSDRKKIKRGVGLPTSISVDQTDGPCTPKARGSNEALSEFPGWSHVESNCPGCQQIAPAWHRYVGTGHIAKARVVGRLTQIMFPLMNIWQNAVDKNVV